MQMPQFMPQGAISEILFTDSIVSLFQNNTQAAETLFKIRWTKNVSPLRWDFLLTEIPILPRRPDGFGNEASIIVRFGFHNFQHFLEAFILPRPFEMTQHIQHMQDVVPEQRRFQLAEVCSHVRTCMDAVPCFHPRARAGFPRQFSRTCLPVILELSQHFQHHQRRERTGVVLATRPAEFSQLRRDGARPAIIADKPIQILNRSLYTLVIAQSPFGSAQDTTTGASHNAHAHSSFPLPPKCVGTFVGNWKGPCSD